MIISYLPAGGGDQFPPIPDKAYFTYSTYTETIDGTEYTFAKLLSCDFSAFTGKEITIPEEIDGYPIKIYNAEMFSTSKLGTVTKIYFTNTDYKFSADGYFSKITLFPEPIEEVYMAYFNQTYITPGSEIRIGSDNKVLKKFEVQNKNTVSTFNKYDFCNCLNLTYNPFPFATVCYERAFANSIIKGKNLDNILILQGDSNFNGCKLFKNVSLNGVTTIDGGSVFEGCYALETIELRNALTINSTSLFRNCTQLKDVYWDNLQNLSFENFTSQGNSPFNGCNRLEHIYTKEENVEYLKSVFAQCTYTTYGSDLVNLVTALPTESTDSPVEWDESWNV